MVQMQDGMVWYGMVWYGMVQIDRYSIVQYSLYRQIDVFMAKDYLLKDSALTVKTARLT